MFHAQLGYYDGYHLAVVVTRRTAEFTARKDGVKHVYTVRDRSRVDADAYKSVKPIAAAYSRYLTRFHGQ